MILQQLDSFPPSTNCMKSIAIWFLVLALALFVPMGSTVQAQPSERTVLNDIPTRIDRKLRRDAARLTLRLQQSTEDLRYQSVVIPGSTVDHLYQVLATVYSQNELARSVAECNVHTFPNPSIDHFVLIYDKDVAWASLLRDGISETTNRELNDLLDEYDLVIEKHVQWDDTQDALTIRSRRPMNISALAMQFEEIEGVNKTDLGIPRLRGNDILVERSSGGWTITYLLRFGAPIGGSGKEHRWIFECSDSFQSTFVREEGDDIPSHLRCQFGEHPMLAGWR